MTTSKWKDGTVTLSLHSGHTLTLDGGVRVKRDAQGFIIDYETRGAADYVLLPDLDKVAAIHVEPAPLKENDVND